jgi:hypothetical protein
MKEEERDNNTCYVREEKERDKEGTDIRRERDSRVNVLSKI